ncbi:hypothetical protein WJX73_002468 [Symbiochloris irregularis]|uniref:Uncharacterized protein n=1 Tax=Symbiochloris irregularis TaxID=706552 RepID=A0AAW1PDA5_9CHLO
MDLFDPVLLGESELAALARAKDNNAGSQQQPRRPAVAPAKGLSLSEKMARWSGSSQASQALSSLPQPSQVAPQHLSETLRVAATNVQSFPRARRRDTTPPPQQHSQDLPHADDTAVVAKEFAVPASASEPAGPHSLRGTLGDGVQEPLILTGVDKQGDPLELQVPASINAHLRSYQRAGVRFLFRQYSRGRGGILADDMGLGKTVQTIAFFSALLGKSGNAAMDSRRRVPSGDQPRRWPLLLICPASVLINWHRELMQWGAFHVVKAHGSDTTAALSAAKDVSAEICLTTFDTFRLQVDKFKDIDWHVVVVDEAHKLKNPSTKIFEAAVQISTRFRYGLTGTAMQNDFGELWALLSWAVPGDMPDWREFHHYYVEDIKLGQRKSTSQHWLGKGRTKAEHLNDMLEKYMLRRTKAIIADLLPKKQDNIVFCSLSPVQMRSYRRVLASPDFRAMINIAAIQECQRCPNCILLPALTVLRKVCNHLELVKVSLEEEKAPDYLKLLRAKKVAKTVLGEDAASLGGLLLQPTWRSAGNTQACGKLTTLVRLLALWKEEPVANKVLIFSHSVRMLKIISDVLLQKQYVYKYLDGSTAMKDRQVICDEFNHTAGVYAFLISTTAGGLGLNLTGANKVIIVDPHWNPAFDLQAQDRAFRLGQKRDVSVYRLIAAGTMEELIYDRQLYKQQQTAIATERSTERRYFDGVQGNKELKGELWGLQNLLRQTLEQAETETQKMVAEQAAQEEKYRIKRCDMAAVAAEGPNLNMDASQELDAGEAGLDSQGGLIAEDMDTVKDQHQLVGEGAVGLLQHGRLLGGSHTEKLRSRKAVKRLRRRGDADRLASAGEADADAADQVETDVSDARLQCSPLQSPVLPARRPVRLSSAIRYNRHHKRSLIRAAKEGNRDGQRGDYNSDQRYQEGQQYQQPPAWASENPEAAEAQRQYAPPGYYGNYGYPYGYPPPQQAKAGGGISPFVWVAIGLGLAFAFNKVKGMFGGGPGGLQEKMMGSMMDQAMQQMMKGGGMPPGGFPGAGAGSQSPSFPSGFPGSGFPPSPSPSSAAASQPAYDTTASAVVEDRGSASEASTSAPSSSRARRRETRPRKSTFSDVGGQAGDAGPAAAAGPTAGPSAGSPFASAAGPQNGGGEGFSLEVMEGLLRDPKMQEAMYQYLPESMRNKETFDWMMSNPEYRKQLQEMMSKQGANLDPSMYESIKDIDTAEMNRQLSAVGLTPSDIITKLMADPPLAAAFQKPNVQKAIMEARNNPLAAMRYQDDPDVMMVFEKMSQMFPQVAQMQSDFGGGQAPDFGGAPDAPPSSGPAFPDGSQPSPSPPQTTPPSTQPRAEPVSVSSVVPPSNEHPPP